MTIEMIQGELDTQAKCPACQKKADGFTSVGHDCKPKHGDLSVCYYCGEMLRYQEDLSLKKLTNKEFSLLDVTLRDMLNSISKKIKSKNKP